MPTFTPLAENNYESWHWDIMMFLKMKELWDITDGSEPMPSYANESAPTPTETKAVKAWKKSAQKAAGYSWHALGSSQKTHVKPHIVKSRTLAEAHSAEATG